MAGLKKNIFYSSILTTANYIFPLITYPYVSRVLGVANIGACNFVDSIINYFLILSTLGIGVVGIREIAKNKSNKDVLQSTFSKLFSINTISTTIALIILIVVMHTVPRLRDYYSLMWIGVLKLIFNYLLIEWFYKGLEDFKYITDRTLIVKCIYVVSVFILVKDPSDLVLYYFLTISTIIVNSIINVIYARRFISFKLTFHGLKEYTIPIFILGIYNVMTSMYTTFNVAYLGFVSDDIEVGFYTTSTKIHSIILMLFSAVTGVLMPRMSALLSENNFAEFKRLIRRSIGILLLFSIPCIIFMELFAHEIVQLIAGSDFTGAVLPLRIIAPLVLIIGIEQVLITQSLMPMSKDKYVLINSVFGAIIGIVLNIIIVPIYESVGSAIVWLLSELTVMISALYFFRKSMREIDTLSKQ